MKNSVSINKIGGTGLMISEEKLKLLIEKILSNFESTEIIFVISALKGITKILDDIFIEMVKNNPLKVDELFETFKQTHLDRIKELKIDVADLMIKYFSEIKLLIKKSTIEENKFKLQAQLLKYGELCSSSIFNDFLKKNYSNPVVLLDSRNFIVGMGSDYNQAKVLQPDTIERINMVTDEHRGKIIVIQGYIASNLIGFDMVLGYDGSDLTAALVALSFLRLKPNHYVSLNFWKDVPGVYENPRNTNSSKVFLNMKLREYLELAVSNSVPVREDALEILSRFDPSRLVIYIRSFILLDKDGTKIAPFPF